MELINGRTAEEIKRGIKCHVSWGDCSTECPYDNVRNKPAHECIQSMTKDALAYIEQLEAAQPRWISVDERLPEVSFQTNRLEYTDPVFAVDDVGDLCIGRFEISKYDGKAVFYGYTADSEEYDPLIVTRWLDNVPEPPKDTKGD